MTAEMIDTKTPKNIETPDIREETPVHEQGLHDAGGWFHSLNKSEKRFHILFYALASLTGILVVQLIWQIAVLTATR